MDNLLRLAVPRWEAYMLMHGHLQLIITPSYRTIMTILTSLKLYPCDGRVRGIFVSENT